MATRHDKSVADFISAQTSESNVYYGKFPKGSEDEAVACMESGGPAPDYRYNAGASAINHPRVQVMIRGKRNEPGQTRDRAKTIEEALKGDQAPSGYVALWKDQSGVAELADDEQGRPRISFNVRLSIDE